jgi:Cu+-exporting ATPase
MTVPAAVLGVLAFGDPVKLSARAAVARLHQQGVRTVMITGDNQGSAQSAAAAVGIDQVFAEVLPDDKAAVVAAPARSGQAASPWSAMASTTPRHWPQPTSASPWPPGLTSRWKAAGITLMRGDPRLVADALDIVAQHPYRHLETRLVLGLRLQRDRHSAGRRSGLLNPVIAGAAMALSSVSVVGNALLLRRWHPATPAAQDTPCAAQRVPARTESPPEETPCNR